MAENHTNAASDPSNQKKETVLRRALTTFKCGVSSLGGRYPRAYSIAIGFFWMGLCGVQTKLLTSGSYPLTLLIWTYSGTIVYSYIIRDIASHDRLVIPFYAIGTAVGLFAASFFK
jgi:hypothetical protein